MNDRLNRLKAIFHLIYDNIVKGYDCQQQKNKTWIFSGFLDASCDVGWPGGQSALNKGPQVHQHWYEGAIFFNVNVQLWDIAWGYEGCPVPLLGWVTFSGTVPKADNSLWRDSCFFARIFALILTFLLWVDGLVFFVGGHSTRCEGGAKFQDETEHLSLA